ncbi:hypothetical protein ACVWWN_006783 [Mycobacterium sp. URHB0021]
MLDGPIAGGSLRYLRRRAANQVEMPTIDRDQVLGWAADS